MAIRYNALGDSLSVNGGSWLPITSFTVMCWARLIADVNNLNILVSLGLAANSSYTILTDTSGTTLCLHNGVALSAPGPQLSLDTPHHLAMTVSGASGPSFLGYLDGALVITWTARPNTDGTLNVGASAFNTAWEVGAVKTWPRVLTQQEIARDVPYYTPQAPGAASWYPFGHIDWSGQGRNFARAGTLEDAQDFPLIWSPRRPEIWRLAS